VKLIASIFNICIWWKVLILNSVGELLSSSLKPLQDEILRSKMPFFFCEAFLTFPIEFSIFPSSVAYNSILWSFAGVFVFLAGLNPEGRKQIHLCLVQIIMHHKYSITVHRINLYTTYQVISSISKYFLMPEGEKRIEKDQKEANIRT
jgi:hypothetical protein